MDGSSRQKNPIPQKNDKGSKFAVECNWINKISQNFQNSLLLKKNEIGFQKKTSFLKNVELSKFSVECDWISDIFQRVQKLRFRKQYWVSGKNPEFRWKQLKVANLMQNATRLVVFSKRSRFRFFVDKIHASFGKILDFLKTLKVAKLHYNASETAKTLKTLKKLVFFKKKIQIFSRKNLFYRKKSLQVSNLH